MPDSQETLEQMAEEIYELYQLVAAARTRRPSGGDDLSETEYLTLDVIRAEELLSIGEIQKRVGVLPAQMSRIIRALETQGGKGYVFCRINPQDRRRIDVSLTEQGRTAHQAYRDARLRSMLQVLAILPPDDRLHFMRIIRQLQAGMKQR